MSDIELFRDSPVQLQTNLTPEQIEHSVAHLWEAFLIAVEAINNGTSPLNEVVGICGKCGNDATVYAAFIRFGGIIHDHATLRYPWFDPTPINNLVELITRWDFGDYDPALAAALQLAVRMAETALRILHHASHLEHCAGCRADYGYAESPSPDAINATFRVHKKKRRPTPFVVIGGEDDVPIVNGRKKPRLTPGQFRVVKALMDATPEKLSKDSLAVRSHTEHPVGMIDRLRRDKDWALVLLKPGKPHGGYGIRVRAQKKT